MLTEKELDLVVGNEREWRKLLLSEIKELREDMSKVKSDMATLKVKVAFFSSGFGAAAAILVKKFFNFD